MKRLIDNEKKVSKATIRKAVAGAVILIILFIISYKFHLPFSDRVTTVIKIGTVAGLIYILATFRGDE